MKITHNNPQKLYDPTPNGYCHSIKIPANAEYIYFSGQSGGEGLNHYLSKDFRTQVKVVLQNLKIILDEYDLQPESIIKITVLIVDHDEQKLKIWSEEMTSLWAKVFYPTSTLIPVPRLALDGMQIEVDAIAVK
ncbi:RidA family protein [Flammeovirga kamogawensis]|uniref:RidA family protein n=1 Tax=Flammeovirga kamogawensis TaxID=373891 RepID=A0ABX8H2E1_9BACT|nr:RidA family protein [Flammeovirga kamogawensis]MBB6460263.1 enamine deaminase RidA (YjgF/YER057c/UK114 family) [Flammeovirga kamogawensis]QWG10074.1 RidA family protein [Flammeovirga kamogawensis]TRX65581.1 RidA family protein [Flammeovirga kamogawensis]